MLGMEKYAYRYVVEKRHFFLKILIFKMNIHLFANLLQLLFHVDVNAVGFYRLVVASQQIHFG